MCSVSTNQWQSQVQELCWLRWPALLLNGVPGISLVLWSGEFAKAQRWVSLPCQPDCVAQPSSQKDRQWHLEECIPEEEVTGEFGAPPPGESLLKAFCKHVVFPKAWIFLSSIWWKGLWSNSTQTTHPFSKAGPWHRQKPVSYTHLTLPTILLV